MTPDKYTNQELMLEVGDGHTLYVHDWGNQQATTVIFQLHGGPGNGSSDSKKSLFHPEQQRVIFHDQRGSGRSLPYGRLEHNTTAKLVEDISTIADKLGIERFVLTGGSWGSTLALAYGLAHPQRVQAMVLDGIFTGSQQEISWLERGLFRIFYPAAWQAFVESVPVEQRHDPGNYHFERILGASATEAKQSAYEYSQLETAIISLDDRHSADDFETFDPTATRLEVSYLTNFCFMDDRHILDNASRLSMPIWLIQGRYDMVCPPVTADELHRQLPNSQLLYTMSGHYAERESWNLKRTILQQLTTSA